MKITINFNERELNTCMNMSKEIANGVEAINKDEHIVGSFGEIKYETEKKEIVFDFKTAYVEATAGLINIFINMAKQLMLTCEMFSNTWFGDIKNLKEEEKNE